MKTPVFTGQLQELITRAQNGTGIDIDHIVSHLTSEVSFATTRYVDYALSLVENPQGILRIEYYLFHGTLIQRNYCSLYFNRLGKRQIVEQACKLGLIDELQAYAR